VRENDMEREKKERELFIDRLAFDAMRGIQGRRAVNHVTFEDLDLK
jgi:hypothetical protein